MQLLEKVATNSLELWSKLLLDLKIPFDLLIFVSYVFSKVIVKV